MSRKRSKKSKQKSNNEEQIENEIDNESACDEENDDIGDEVYEDENEYEEESEEYGQKRKLDDESNEWQTKKKGKVTHSQSQHKYIKPPSADELQKFREVQFLQHSNLFRMQLDEMLTTLEVTQKMKAKINSWLTEFTHFVKNLDVSKEYHLNKYDWIEDQKLDMPIKWIKSLPKIKGNFHFHPPKDVSPIGSYASDLIMTNNCVVDVALILPKNFMQSSDLSNGKWLLRRALYLSWIGKALKECETLVSSISWTRHLGVNMRPILQVKPAGKLGKTWTFNLFPVPPTDFFKFDIISPRRGNVTPEWFFQRDKSHSNASKPTPYYNWLCGLDLVMMSHQIYIKDNLKHLNWIQGVKALKVWLMQRNFIQGEACINSHIMTLYVIYLAKLHKISPQMSPYQVFRTTLLSLCQTNWCNEAINFPETKLVEISGHRPLVLSDFQSEYHVVFVDPTGFLNLMADVSVAVYKDLIHEANTGLEMLQLSSTNSFEALFIQKIKFHLKFDQALLIRFDNRQSIKSIFNASKLEDKELIEVGRLGDLRATVYASLLSTLSQALKDRVDLIGIEMKNSPTWLYGAKVPDVSYDLVLGFLLNPTASIALLTKGPSADSPEAAEFRQFWGDLATMRRFRDSTFHEAVLWRQTSDPVGDRRLIIGSIASHILKRHFEIDDSRLVYVARQLEDMLRKYYVFGDEEPYNYGTGEEAVTAAIIAFDTLSKKLRGLVLPLKITGIQTTSDVLKHSSVYPPLPSKVSKPYLTKEKKKADVSLYSLISDDAVHIPNYRCSIEIQVFLEISGKWPDDLVAIKAIKCEFMCKVADLLKKEGITAVVFPSHLSIVWEGYVFNLKVCYRREIFLLKSIGNEAASSLVSSMEVDLNAANKLEKEIEILPQLTSAFNSLQSDFSSFSGAVRLIRRWVSSQLLMPHLPPLVINLLVAHIYLSPQPCDVPHTPHVALLRFLYLMSSVDWRYTPVFVNLQNQFEANDESELSKRFTNNRSSYPALFICTPYELRPLPPSTDLTEEDYRKRYSTVSCWSREGPSIPILSRMKLVAEAGLESYCRNSFKTDFDFKVLFRPSLDAYNVLIHLEESQLSRAFENVERKKKVLRPYEHFKGEMLPVTDYDPAQLYLKELRDAFGAHALFFHDEFGGKVIGVVWKPHVYEEKEPKMGSLDGHKLVGVNDFKQVVNTDSIVEQFSILGKGLVNEVVVQR